MKRCIGLFLLFILAQNTVQAQVNTTSFGFSIKPILPSKYFRTGAKEFEDNGIIYNLAQQSGFSAGGLVRRGINKRLSFETGILFVKRQYELSITDTTWTGVSNFKIIGYEIPLSALVFVQLGKEIFMNAGLGVSMDIFPSDVESYDPDDKYFRQFSARTSKFSTGVISNIGVEWRTKKSGILYFGASYHRSFNTIYNTVVEYYPDRNYNNQTSTGRTDLQGDYFTFDFRYYFYEPAVKK